MDYSICDVIPADWSTYVSTQLMVWETLHQLWLTKYAGPVHIVFYEVLVKDTKDTLQGILDFLNQTITEVSTCQYIKVNLK